MKHIVRKAVWGDIANSCIERHDRYDAAGYTCCINIGNWVGKLLKSPFRFVADVVIVLWTIIGFLLPARREQRNAMADIEDRRRALNEETFEALDAKPNPTKQIPPEILDRLHRLEQQQIILEENIRQLLGAGEIRAEQGFRAGAVSVLLQLSILLRRAELQCGELARIIIVDSPTREQYQESLRFAEGDLNTASQQYAAVIDRYVRPLQSRAMRRERFARRLYWLLTFRWRGAFDRDAAIKDIRQELRGSNGLMQELRAGLRVFGSEFLSSSLRAAVDDYDDYAEIDDVSLVRHVGTIVKSASDQGFKPVDENYPVLIVRFWAIRGSFNELPVWWWSLRWRCYLTILQAWLYLFASDGALAKQDKPTSRRLLRKALQMTERIGSLITEIFVLERPVKAVLTSFGMIGRQQYIGGFFTPPTKERLQEMADALTVRLNQRT